MIEVFAAINSWILSHQALVVAVGIPLPTALAASVVSFLSNAATLEARKRDRELQVLFKIADYRNSWIGDLSSDLAEFQTQFFGDPDREKIEKAYLVSRRVLLRLDYRYDEAKKLVLAMNQLLDANKKRLNAVGSQDSEPVDFNQALTDFQMSAMLLLSSEWIMAKVGLLDSVNLKETRT